MTSTRDEETRLSPRDEAFVRRVAAAFAPPPRSPAQRAAFSAKLEARLGGAAWRGRRALGFAALATTAAAMLLLRTVALEPAPALAPQEPALAAGAGPSPEEVLLALASEPGADGEEALPPDYAAIASVLLSTGR